MKRAKVKEADSSVLGRCVVIDGQSSQSRSGLAKEEKTESETKRRKAINDNNFITTQ